MRTQAAGFGAVNFAADLAARRWLLAYLLELEGSLFHELRSSHGDSQQNHDPGKQNGRQQLWK